MNIDLTKRRFDDTHDQEGINTLLGLYDLIKENIQSNFLICEIGCFKGVSSELFANHCKYLFCIDPWKQYSEKDQTCMQNAESDFNKLLIKYNNIIKIKEYSENIHHIFANNIFDLIYIDGSHEYNDVKKDILNWLPKIKNNGFISGHDSNQEDVKMAIQDTIGLDSVKFYSDSSWCKKVIL